MPIQHVSDTARWVAVYRAMESERPDALFRDPYARRLAGELGHEIVRTMKNGAGAAWSMIVRTQVMDELLLRHVREDGVDCVLNLAAGLDARPFRLVLPPTLRWVDVDFADVLDYKWTVLKDATPSCRYERMPADLSNGEARRAIFAAIGREHQRVFVIAEGLLLYLGEDDVSALARDLRAQPPFRWWLIDLASARLLKWMQRSWGKRATEGNAAFRFAPAAGTKFFEPSGWREIEFRSSWIESRRLNRQMRGAWLWGLIGLLSTKRQRQESERMAGVVLMGTT
ncbi:MAG: class I SAM-dependent methyltransferase [Gemmatimonadaceae bacterium]|nr:class I SAM-dependent methyltransferase [Gemmatimonadaceae bacterium]